MLLQCPDHFKGDSSNTFHGEPNPFDVLANIFGFLKSRQCYPYVRELIPVKAMPEINDMIRIPPHLLDGIGRPQKMPDELECDRTSAR